MPINPSLAGIANPKILLLGSGGLSIGQAGEFDYSGTQAIKALTEEGCHVVVVNPNIATVQTNPEEGVTVYLYPVELNWVKKVIEKEKPHGIIAGFGGQTAINCLIELEESGVLKENQVINFGTPAEVLKLTEDRDAFAKRMQQIGIPIPPSIACETVDECIKAAASISYPVILRAAFALGGLGSGFADNEEELRALAAPALANSPQVLIEKSLKGWKEVEYEVMRDSAGNIITICNMENFDPLGIHTGDSIVVAPSQTLSDNEFQLLRNKAIEIVESLGVLGECNVQYSLDPESESFYVIEVNARLSRSSALASKATGYPIAYIAAKVVLGFDLLELKNPVTGVTYAYFEPALDYITIKIPRWDLLKFHRVDRRLGSTMKSVGEVMAIGRTFPETLQKAVRMVTEREDGLSAKEVIEGGTLDCSQLAEDLAKPTDQRLYHVIAAFRRGMTVDEVHQLTRINEWFLHHCQAIAQTEQDLTEKFEAVATKGLSKNLSFVEFTREALKDLGETEWRDCKMMGFGDAQVASVGRRVYGGQEPSATDFIDSSLMIRKLRSLYNVKPVIKKIDTTAGEYPSPSNYLYLSYGGLYNDPLPDDGKVFSAIVLGGGSYRIGTSVEFDWCAVSCSKRLQAAGWRSIVVNCNPETVSTDYNSSDHLFFEELTLERILDIFEYENPVGVIASMGGQLPNRLAVPLSQCGVKLLGHQPNTIDKAEDRSKFSALLDEAEISQPRWLAATTKDELDSFMKDVGFPVLVRPSYVLSGAAMRIAYNQSTLDECLAAAQDLSPDHPVVISEFIEGAREIELDGVAKNGKIVSAIVSEHVENAGVHSGDATTVVPAQRIYVETARKVRHAGKKIAASLNLNGPFNIQFLAKEGEIKVIECNARAARSFPFVSKTVGLNLADAATDISIGIEPDLSRLNEDDLPFVGVKAPMFSFSRLAGADPVLGVEMASTGEVGCIGNNFSEALRLALQATGIKPPKKGVLVSSGQERDKLKFLSSADVLTKLGIPMYATHGTAKYLRDHGFEVTDLNWPDEGGEDVISAIKSGVVDLVINLPKSTRPEELTRGYAVRQSAVKFGCSLITNMEKAIAFIHSLGVNPDFEQTHEVLPLQPFQRR